MCRPNFFATARFIFIPLQDPLEPKFNLADPMIGSATSLNDVMVGSVSQFVFFRLGLVSVDPQLVFGRSSSTISFIFYQRIQRRLGQSPTKSLRSRKRRKLKYKYLASQAHVGKVVHVRVSGA